MAAVNQIPKEFEKAIGPEGTEKFVLFLNEAFEEQKKELISTVSDRFHNHVTTEVSKVRLEVGAFRVEVTEEIAKVRLEVADLRADMAGLRTELKSDMAELLTELKTDMADLRTELKTDMANLRTELKTDIGHLDNRISDLRADFKSDNASLHKAIAVQTRWLLVLLLAGAVLYPLATKLIDKLLP